MIYNGLLITNASGRLGADVFSRNAGGPYVRALGNPNPNPATDEQVAARTAMALIVSRWRGLTQAQRADWSAMSSRFPVPGRTGVVRDVGGLPAFTRANHPRIHSYKWLDSPLRYIDDPPEVPVVPFTLPNPFHAVFPINDFNFYLTYRDTDAWTLNALSALIVWVSPPLPLSVHYYKSPMTMVAAVVTPAESPLTIPTMYPEAVEITADTHFKLKLRLVLSDGSVTTDQWFDVPSTT